MITDYILNCPSDTLFSSLSDNVQAIITGFGAEWPDFPQPGTQEFNERKLLHVRMNQMLSKAELEKLFIVHSLDWSVLSIRSAYQEGSQPGGIDGLGNPVIVPAYITEYLAPKANFLPFINPVWIFETESRPVVLTDDIFLSTYMGTEPIHL